VWTLEKKGLKPQINISFDDAEPTFTHMALLSLSRADHIHYIGMYTTIHIGTTTGNYIFLFFFPYSSFSKY